MAWCEKHRQGSRHCVYCEADEADAKIAALESALSALRKENERLREDFRALVERVCGVLDVSGTHNGLRLWQAIETVMEPHKHLIWEKPVPTPKPLSDEAKAARCPPPPEELVGALQDRIHPTSGRLLDTKPIKPPDHGCCGCSCHVCAKGHAEGTHTKECREHVLPTPKPPEGE